jgi:hypothetical protein
MPVNLKLKAVYTPFTLFGRLFYELLWFYMLSLLDAVSSFTVVLQRVILWRFDELNAEANQIRILHVY